MGEVLHLPQRRARPLRIVDGVPQPSERDRLGEQVETAWGAFHIAHAFWIDQPTAETYLLRTVALATFRRLSDQFDATPPDGPRAA